VHMVRLVDFVYAVIMSITYCMSYTSRPKPSSVRGTVAAPLAGRRVGVAGVCVGGLLAVWGKRSGSPCP